MSRETERFGSITKAIMYIVDSKAARAELGLRPKKQRVKRVSPTSYVANAAPKGSSK